MKDFYDERHKNMSDRIDKAEKRIDIHSNRLDSLEQSRAATDVRVDNLIKEITNLINMMKWFIGLAGSTLLTFFVWYIQSL